MSPGVRKAPARLGAASASAALALGTRRRGRALARPLRRVPVGDLGRRRGEEGFGSARGACAVLSALTES